MRNIIYQEMEVEKYSNLRSRIAGSCFYRVTRLKLPRLGRHFCKRGPWEPNIVDITGILRNLPVRYCIVSARLLYNRASLKSWCYSFAVKTHNFGENERHFLVGTYLHMDKIKTILLCFYGYELTNVIRVIFQRVPKLHRTKRFLPDIPKKPLKLPSFYIFKR